MNLMVFSVFQRCVEAIREEALIKKVSEKDKEYHFQNWFRDRRDETAFRHNFHFDTPGRNTYPDFRLVEITEGYELKGLAYPGREATFDSNSRVPTGIHNGRTIYYVFGRYPDKPDGDEYPVLDLVICHGDFLNADHEYTHKNKSIQGFGSYGDILIRDRKMYVVPTPFKIAEGTAHHQTLILPADIDAGPDFLEVGELIRIEAAELIVGSAFDLRTNEMQPEKMQNPRAGTKHTFHAWRLKGSPATPVTIGETQSANQEDDPIEDEDAFDG
jgi:hypothetical protein